MAFAFLPARNYVGSSGYSASGQRLTSTPQQSTAADDTDYPIYDPVTGKYVSFRTGKPFTGKDPWQGQTYANGELQSAAATGAGTGQATGDPNKDFAAVNIEKTPGMASTTDDLLKTFKDNASNSLKGFSEYLSNFKTDLEAARNKANQATNTAGTEAAITGAQQQYSGNLDAANAAYQQALAQSAANERGVVTQAMDTLPSYDAAVNRMQGIATGAVPAYLSRYKLRTGTPTSMGGAETQLMAKALYEAAAPFEYQKINRRYDILGNMSLPVERDIAGQNLNYASNFLPQTAASRYSSATNAAQYIQSLRQATANMSLQDATAYLQAAGVPDQVRSQVLSGQIQNLGGIGNLYGQAYYQGLNYLPGASLNQPEYYSMATGGYPTSTPRMPSYGGTGTGTSGYPALRANNAPVNVGPSDNLGRYSNLNQRYVQDIGGYWDAETGNFYNYGEPAVSRPMDYNSLLAGYGGV